MSIVRVLFVCTGNLCRSPMAQGIMQSFALTAGCADHLSIDSAGTHARAGRPPEKFAVKAVLSYGADIAEFRSRAIEAADFDNFDKIIAMDLDHLDYLRSMDPVGSGSKVRLLLSYASELRLTEVPDPYGCKLEYFQYVAKLIAAGSQQLLDELIGGSATA